MEISDIAALRSQVLWAAFAASFLFGAVAQRSHFCTMGAISDIVNMGDWTRMRMWALAVGVATMAFGTMAGVGLIDPMQTIYASGRVVWLSALVGGALFGFGMVLASGCGSKTLVRIGGGSLKALVVFCVMGISAFATLRGITAVLRVNTVDQVAFDLPGGSALPAMLGQALSWNLPQASLVLGLLVGGALCVWALWGHGLRTAPELLLGGLGVGSAIAALWWITGSLGFVAEHPETLEPVFLATNSGRMESLTFTAPMAYTLDWLIYFSDSSKVLTLGVVSVLGVVLGAWVVALASRTFHWEGFRGTQDTALHIAGAVCMGVGGVTALGCTVGQGLSGLSTLSLTSFVAVAGIMVGGVGGLRFQLWLLERE